MVNRYKLNTIPCGVYPLVMVSQYDTARTIEFELYEGDEIITPTSANILIGTNQYEGTISNEVVSFSVPSELTEDAQSLFGEIVVSDSKGHYGTLNFRFKVDSTPMEIVTPINTLGTAKPLSNGLKMGLGLTFEKEEPTEEETKEEEAEPIEEEETEEPIEEPTEEEEEAEDELGNDTEDNN